MLHDVASEHQNIVILENEWRSGTFNQEANIVLIFGADDVEHRLELTSSSVWRGVWLLTNLGIHHISIGIDHILFLMALLLPSVLYRKQPLSTRLEPVSGFRPAFIHVVTIVTLFTIAHSVTLSLAALGVVQLSSRLIESIIALSIGIRCSRHHRAGISGSNLACCLRVRPVPRLRFCHRAWRNGTSDKIHGAISFWL